MSDTARWAAQFDLAGLIAQELPREWFGEAVGLVREIQDRRVWTNHERREFACGMLMQHLHCEEHKARCLTELAMVYLKTQEQ